MSEVYQVVENTHWGKNDRRLSWRKIWKINYLKFGKLIINPHKIYHFQTYLMKFLIFVPFRYKSFTFYEYGRRWSWRSFRIINSNFYSLKQRTLHYHSSNITQSLLRKGLLPQRFTQKLFGINCHIILVLWLYFRPSKRGTFQKRRIGYKIKDLFGRMTVFRFFPMTRSMPTPKSRQGNSSVRTPPSYLLKKFSSSFPFSVTLSPQKLFPLALIPPE